MYKSSTKNQIRVEIERIFHSHNIPYTLRTVKIEVNQCICVNVHTGIFTVYRYFYGIPVFLWYVGLPVKNFWLDINTGMTKYLLFDFSAVYRPALIYTGGIASYSLHRYHITKPSTLYINNLHE